MIRSVYNLKIEYKKTLNATILIPNLSLRDLSYKTKAQTTGPGGAHQTERWDPPTPMIPLLSMYPHRPEMTLEKQKIL